MLDCNCYCYCYTWYLLYLLPYVYPIYPLFRPCIPLYACDLRIIITTDITTMPLLH